MITLHTPTAKIISELNIEKRRAIYWLRKHYHGDAGFNEMLRQLYFEAKEKKKNVCSDVIEYTSTAGNHWMSFSTATYYPKANQAYTQTTALCYHETMQSIGVWLPGSAVNDDILYFTDHFFLRFCDRLGIKDIHSKKVVQKFILHIPGIVYRDRDVYDKHGREYVDCRFPGSIGRGIRRKDGPIVEIRTFLKDSELSPKQLWETKELRIVADRHDMTPPPVKVAGLISHEDMAAAVDTQFIVNYDSDLNSSLQMQCMTLSMLLVGSLSECGYISNKNYPLLKHHAKVNRDIIIDIIRTGDDSEDYLKAKLEQMLMNDNLPIGDIDKLCKNITNKVNQYKTWK